MFSIETTIILIAGGLVAGILNGIVGMAVLTLYPILLATGISPIMANITATISIIFSGCSAVYSSRREIKPVKKETALITLLTTIGCIGGTLILVNSSNDQFKKVVPFIIMLAGIMMIIPKKQDSKSQVTGFFKFIPLVLAGAYNGYFGAGSGIIITALLSRITGQKYPVYNAMRNVLSLAGNLTSAIIFVFLMPVDWLAIIPLAIGLLVGGYLGPIVVRFIPTKIMEIGVSWFAIGMAIYLFISEY